MKFIFFMYITWASPTTTLTIFSSKVLNVGEFLRKEAMSEQARFVLNMYENHNRAKQTNNACTQSIDTKDTQQMHGHLKHEENV